ncbi:MAG TPA: choice-of-anchor Q domain-containing protein [Rhodanobacteraceae bacterium]|nr:choice-of-anchor Q domain-containing protein [Rhodanobacteraceae bacterium]
MKMPPPRPSARRAPLTACLALVLCGPAVAATGSDAPLPGRALVHAWEGRPDLRPGAARARIAAALPRLVHAPATLPVTSCLDDGSPGTLRAVVASAASGDTVDMSELACGTITLATGQINVYVADLTLQGPGQSALTIDGNHAGRVLAAYALGTLTLADLTVANGYQTSPAYGGCIYTQAYDGASGISLSHVTVDHCTAYSAGSGLAAGGGILTMGSLWLAASTLSNNVATAPNGTQIVGGAAYVSFDLVASNSTVTGNSAVRATAGSAAFALAGGINVAPRGSQSSITGSTFSDNVADSFGGALFMYVPASGAGTTSMQIRNSTISGNTSGSASGIEIDTGSNAPFQLALGNSTIAFNTFTSTESNRCGGITQAGYTDSVVDLESTIIANDTGPGGIESDACGRATSSLTGANSLVMVSVLPLPPGTLSDDPMLGPLQDNGGPTLTHALLPGSPAIDNGNNVAALDFDQRGAGFARSSGRGPDIGAFEVQTGDDTLFANGFDP